MSDFFQNVNFLEHFLATVFVLQLAELYHFDSHKLPCKLMYSKINLSKCSVSDFLNKFVKIKTSWWKFAIIFDKLFVIFNDFVPFFHNFFV